MEIEIIVRDLIGVQVMNVRDTGPVVPIAPGADPSDHAVDVVTIAADDVVALDRYARQRLQGASPALPPVFRLTGQRASGSKSLRRTLAVDDQLMASGRAGAVASTPSRRRPGCSLPVSPPPDRAGARSDRAMGTAPVTTASSRRLRRCGSATSELEEHRLAVVLVDAVVVGDDVECAVRGHRQPSSLSGTEMLAASRTASTSTASCLVSTGSGCPSGANVDRRRVDGVDPLDAGVLAELVVPLDDGQRARRAAAVISDSPTNPPAGERDGVERVVGERPRAGGDVVAAELDQAGRVVGPLALDRHPDRLVAPGRRAGDGDALEAAARRPATSASGRRRRRARCRPSSVRTSRLGRELPASTRPSLASQKPPSGRAATPSRS